MKTQHFLATVLASFLLPGSFAFVRGEDDAGNAEVQRLVEQLGADQPADREAATARLLEIGEPVRTALEAASKSEDAETKHRAKIILDKLDLRKSSVEELFSGGSNDVYRTLAVIENRGRGGGESALDASDRAAIIQMALKDDRADYEVRQRLLSIISSQKLRSTWPALITLAEKEPETAVTALRTLKALNVPEATEEITRIAPGLCASESVGDVINELFRLKIDRDVLARVIEGALESDAGDGRTFTLLAFAAKKQIPLSATVVLDKILSADANYANYWRQHIKNAVCPAGLADEVKKRWKDVDATNLGHFVAIIKEAKLRELVPLLVEAWSQPWVAGRAETQQVAQAQRWSYVQTNQACAQIVEAVKRLGGEEQLVALLSDEKAETRIAALQMLQAARFRGVFEETERLLKDSDSRVRAEALGLAALIDPVGATASVETCLDDPDATVSTRAVRILVALKGTACTDGILRFLRDGRPALVAAAIDVLPDLDLDKVLSELLAMHGEPATSSTALYAMAVLISKSSPVRRHEIMLAIQGKVDPGALEQQLRLLQAIPR
ncbi:MAG: HEAT repeat domain-containing protein [Planctomycetota bacterium]|nr:HEAT repeat domain-containing protein [Planctomycetota bacterium]